MAGEKNTVRKFEKIIAGKKRVFVFLLDWDEISCFVEKCANVTKTL